MRLLLLFLLIYFLYRYCKYLFARLGNKHIPNPPPYNINSHQKSAHKKNDDGEYVDFEEIK